MALMEARSRPKVPRETRSLPRERRKGRSGKDVGEEGEDEEMKRWRLRRAAALRRGSMGMPIVLSEITRASGCSTKVAKSI